MAELPEQPSIRGLSIPCQSLVKSMLKAAHEHAKLIGLVLFHWNIVHASLQAIFAQLLGDNVENGKVDLEPGINLWNALKSDDAQREILRTYARAKLKNDPSLFEAINWAINAIGKLSTYRNDATHVPFVLHNRDAFPIALLSEKARLDRLNNVGHRKLFWALVHDLSAIYRLLSKILLKIEYQERDVSLDRPLLRSPALVAKSPPKTNSRPRR